MKLEVGKYYRTRDGRKVGPLGEFSNATMHNGMGDSRLWNLDGSRYYRNDPDSDLIAEWHEEPKQHGIGYTMTKADIGLTGTLAELGVEIGDVVSWLTDGVDEDDHHEVTALSDMYGDMFGSPHAQLSGKYCVPMGHQDYQFRLISRAQPKGPVITETVTTEVKHIVNGVYGKVEVQRRGNSVGIIIDDYFTSDDLTAAIETLTAVRDAMPQNCNT